MRSLKETTKSLINKVKNNKDYQAIIENFTALSILNAINYILPLVTFPYLVRVLGVEKFGLLSFAQSVVAYFTLLTSYGFYLTGVQQIALRRESKEESGRILSSILGAKIFLTFVGFLILSLLVFSIPMFKRNALIYFLCFTAVLSEAINPNWFFRGIEKMRYMIILAIVSKIMYIIAVFLFVKSGEDYIIVPLLVSITAFAANALGIRIAHSVLGYKITIPKLGEVFWQIKDGYTIFLSQVAINLYTNTNTVLLGFLGGTSAVGYYSAVQKIISILLGFFVLIQQAVFPFSNRVIAQSEKDALKLFKNLTYLIGACSLAISIVIFLLSPLLVKLILGPKYLPSVPTLRILAFLPFIVSISQIFGILIMVPMGYKKEFMKILWSASIVSIILSLLLVPALKQNGTAISSVLTETFVSLSMLVFVRKIRAL
uniref:Flippase n=1 Tax=candidate division WOR-3 bacterium TaxID=2052148 RepID=A0A7C2P452_UNCW3